MCRSLGLSKWAIKEDWPLHGLKPVRSVKVFGKHITISYSETINLNWQFRLNKFHKTLMSWSSRILDSIHQRVEVLKIFTLSRIYYEASTLQMRKRIV